MVETICKICNQDLCTLKKLVCHLKSVHKISSKAYYDEFYKNEEDGFCRTCGKPVNFSKLSKGYPKYCSYKCMNTNLDKIELQKKTTFEHYRCKFAFTITNYSRAL